MQFTLLSRVAFPGSLLPVEVLTPGLAPDVLLQDPFSGAWGTHDSAGALIAFCPLWDSSLAPSGLPGSMSPPLPGCGFVLRGTSEWGLESDGLGLNPGPNMFMFCDLG